MEYSTWKPLYGALESSGKSLVAIDTNLIDEIWENRPPISKAPIKPLEIKYTGICLYLHYQRFKICI